MLFTNQSTNTVFVFILKHQQVGYLSVPSSPNNSLALSEQTIFTGYAYFIVTGTITVRYSDLLTDMRVGQLIRTSNSAK